jgi:4-hydroxy-tetrahydrodipicolinate reductase
MIARAAGIELDEVTTTWEEWVTPDERKTAKGIIGADAAPDWPSGDGDDVHRVDIEGTPSISQETKFRFTDGSGRDAAAAGCPATGLRALNAVPAVNDLSPGWVTPLDLPLIAGQGRIR